MMFRLLVMCNMLCEFYNVMKVLFITEHNIEPFHLTSPKSGGCRTKHESWK